MPRFPLFDASRIPILDAMRAPSDRSSAADEGLTGVDFTGIGLPSAKSLDGFHAYLLAVAGPLESVGPVLMSR